MRHNESIKKVLSRRRDGIVNSPKPNSQSPHGKHQRQDYCFSQKCKHITDSDRQIIEKLYRKGTLLLKLRAYSTFIAQPFIESCNAVGSFTSTLNLKNTLHILLTELAMRLAHELLLMVRLLKSLMICPSQ